MLFISRSTQRQNRFGWIANGIYVNRALGVLLNRKNPWLRSDKYRQRNRRNRKRNFLPDWRSRDSVTSFYIFFIEFVRLAQFGQKRFKHIYEKAHAFISRIRRHAIHTEWEIFLWDLSQLCISPNATPAHTYIFISFSSFMHWTGTVSA